MTQPAPLAAPVVAGVDTHTDTHHVAVLALTGAKLGDRQVPATPAGYAELVSFLRSHGTVQTIGVEGTNSYGAGLARHLHQVGETVVEVIRPKRAQRRRGKSDPIDAYAAAAQVLAEPENLPKPKTTNGSAEQIRVLLAVRNTAVKNRATAQQQIKSLLVTAPDPVRDRYRGLPDTELINRLAASKPGVATDTVSAANGQALRHLARRHQYLTSEIDALDIDLAVLVEQAAPSLVASRGIGTMTAAQMLITAGDNPDRLRSEAAFAALCGTSPIPASSGRTNRYRLNRGGDRQANKALHQIALARLANDSRTRAYAAKKRAEGKTTKDVLRCLKRAIAREIYRHLSRPCPVPDNGDLRPLRQAKGHTLTEVARHFGAWPARISDIERGKRRDDDFAHTYREWLLAS